MKTDHAWKELSGRLKSVFEKKEKPTTAELTPLLQNCDAQIIALAIEDLETDNAVTVFKAVPDSHSAAVLALINPELTEKILKHLEPGQVKELLKKLKPKEAAEVLTEVPRKQQKHILKEHDTPEKAVTDTKLRMKYPKNSAGRLLTTQYLRTGKGQKVKDVLALLRQTEFNEKVPEDIFVVDEVSNNDQPVQMYGVISIRELLSHDDSTLVDEVMEKDIVSAKVTDSQLDTAALLSKYQFKTLPVVDKDHKLIGVIPVDELLKVMIANLRNLYTKAVGTDAQKMAKLSSLQEAKLRVPWLLVTMAIELVAGLVIHKYDAVLKKVILLASFMPVISAISGNVGLQAAAITVRAVDTKLPGTHNVFKAVSRELATSVFMAIVCGLVLGTIGSIWAKHIPFGLVIGGALMCSMLTAGLMGTIIPMLSKKLGFDPATTAGLSKPPYRILLVLVFSYGWQPPFNIGLLNLQFWLKGAA